MIPGQDEFMSGSKPDLKITQIRGPTINPGSKTWMHIDETCTFELSMQDKLVCIVEIRQGQIWGLLTRIPEEVGVDKHFFRNLDDDYIIPDSDIIMKKEYAQYILPKVLNFYYGKG